MTLSTCDVLVIGAGPAGAAAARLLAAWGHRVVVADRPGDVGRLAESIPPSAQKILAAIGALAAIEDAGFVRWTGNTVWWGGPSPRREPFAPGQAGYQVVRAAFDRRLRDLALRSGAELRSGSVQAVVVPGLSGARGVPEATLASADGPTRLRASYVLDCSGRAGAVARQGLRDSPNGPRTVALAGLWRSGAGWAGIDPGHTLVASYADGWAWSVPTAPGRRQFTVMVDPERTVLRRGAPSREVYLAELAKVAPFRNLIEGATLSEGPWGADATPYGARRYAGPGFLLVGDAASFIDPLSSFGVKKALASGWLAAVATHTALVRPGLADEALAFFDRREREAVAAAARQAARLAAEAAVGNAHPFWLARTRSAIGPEDVDDDRAETRALSSDPAVLAAFAALKTRAPVRFRAAPGVQVIRRPLVRDREIVLDDHLRLPAWPDGIHYLAGVDVVALLRLAPEHADVGELYGAYVSRHGPAALPDFLGALAVLVAQGAVEA
jgi:flavin-dependent dehydrogenase